MIDALGLLTRRQVRTLQMLATYGKDKLIAHAMGISAGTVKANLQRIRDRLDNGRRMTRVELAMIGQELNELAKNPHEVAMRNIEKYAPTVDSTRTKD